MQVLLALTVSYFNFSLLDITLISSQNIFYILLANSKFVITQFFLYMATL